MEWASLSRMRWGMYVPTSGAFGDPRLLMEIAASAEQNGWDGFFLWDVLPGTGAAVVDPWTTMAAIAGSTRRIMVGTLVTPLPRRRPWQLGLEALTIDRLSGGRLIMGVGLGGPVDPRWEAVGELAPLRARGELFDESLAIMRGIWSGRAFAFTGTRYPSVDFGPLPVPTTGRIPLWAGTPELGPGRDVPRATLRRAAGLDGLFPWWVGPTPAEVAPIVERIRQLRGNLEGYDITIALEFLTTARTFSRDLLRQYAAAGVTWLLEGIALYVPKTPAQARATAAAGPPQGAT